MAKNKKHRHEEHEEHVDESWLIPYADLLTLLLALFIVLFAMSKVNETKAAAMFQSMYNAFNTISVFSTDSGGQNDTNNSFTSQVPEEATDTSLYKAKDENEDAEENVEQKAAALADNARLQNLVQNLQTYIDQKGLNASISLTDLQEGIQITVKDVIVFDSGSDNLRTNFIPTLQDIVGMLKMVDNALVIEGHTDNQPIRTAQFKSNWELSGARSLSVLHYIQSQGIDPARLRFQGYGEYKPLYPNDTHEHREANRRVNIVVLRK